MFTLFINPLTAVVFESAGSFASAGLCRLKSMSNKGHDLTEGLDILDRMHARLINRGQYPVERDGLDYWCHARDSFMGYNQPGR